MGGKNETSDMSINTVQSFQMVDNRLTLLHYVDATGLARLLGTNQC